MPTCCSCGLSFPKDVFAKSQLKKPADKRRCLGCAAELEDAKAAAEVNTNTGTAGTAAGPSSAGIASSDAIAHLSAISTMERQLMSPMSIPNNAPTPTSDELFHMFDKLLEANRMTQQEYEVAKGLVSSSFLSSDNITRQRLHLLWKPCALSLPCQVSVHDLVARPDLNNKRGVAVSWLPEQKRFCVEIPVSSNARTRACKQIAIRPNNLRDTSAHAVGDQKTAGRCWNGHLWNTSVLRCNGRIPVHGEVCCILEGPYPNQTAEEKDDLDRGLGQKDRKASSVVFTFDGYAHKFKSASLGGTPMLLESAKIKIEPHLQVHKAFWVDDGKGLLVSATAQDSCTNHLMLMSYPDLRLIKKWDASDGAEWQDDVWKVDFYENLLAIVFQRPGLLGRSIDARLCCYSYHNGELKKEASWPFTGHLAELQNRHKRITDVCVTCGGVGGTVTTLSLNGIVRIWRTDSIAGCTAILNGSLENLGLPGTVGGLSEDKSGHGCIVRVPQVMQSELSQHHDLDTDILDIAVCHKGTLSFFQTSQTMHRVPMRALAMSNPLITTNQVKSIAIDNGLSNGVCFQVGEVSYEDDGEDFDVVQLAMWSPFRKAACIAYELPKELEIPIESGIQFVGGRLLIAGGLGDTRKSQMRGEELKYGKSTCFVYVVSAREDEGHRNGQVMGIDSMGVSGMLEDLTWGRDVEEDPRRVNISVAMPHACPGDGIPPAITREVRPCCFLCHGCGAFECLNNMSNCSGCSSAMYCSRACQKKAWPMHKASCKAVQSVTKWLAEQGYGH